MKKYAAEFVATFFLVFAGAGAIVADVYLTRVRLTASFGVLGIAFAHGLALALAIAAVGHISGGHANPAITIAFWVTRRIKAKDVLGYIVAQLGGGALAALLVKSMMPADAVNFAGVGVPALAEGLNFRQGLVIEVVLTFFLAFVIWGVAVDRRGPRSIAPLAIGLVLVFDTLAGGPFTGAAMNPARWFGPALVGTEWTNFPLWILGPILGGLLGGLVYETLFLGEQPPVEMEEELLEEDEGQDDEEEEEFEPVPTRASAPSMERPRFDEAPRRSERPPRPAESPPPPRPSEAPTPAPSPPPPDSVVTPPRDVPPVSPPSYRPSPEPPSTPSTSGAPGAPEPPRESPEPEEERH